MTPKKKLHEKLSQALKKATAPKKFVLLYIPEHPETAPHWLFWLLIIGLLALGVAMLGTHLAGNPLVQTYLPSI